MKTKNELEVSVPQLVEILKEVNKPSFFYVESETDYDMLKTNNPFLGRVKKYTKRNYLVGINYEDRVNNNMNKEGLERDFVSLKPKGKTHISKCVLTDDKTGTKFYVNLEINRNEVFYETKIMLDGIDISTKTNDPIVNFNNSELLKSINKFLPKKTEVKTTRQEQEVVVKWITLTISNIKKCTLNGTIYTVI